MFGEKRKYAWLNSLLIAPVTTGQQKQQMIASSHILNWLVRSSLLFGANSAERTAATDKSGCIFFKTLVTKTIATVTPMTAPQRELKYPITFSARNVAIGVVVE